VAKGIPLNINDVFLEVEEYLTGDIIIVPTPDKLKKNEKVVGELNEKERRYLGASIMLCNKINELKGNDGHIAFLKHQELHARCFLSVLTRLQDQIDGKIWTVKTDFRLVVKEKSLFNFLRIKKG